LINQQTSKNIPNGGGIGDLCGGGGGGIGGGGGGGGVGGGGGHYRAWRGSGVWHRNPRDDIRAGFRSRRYGAQELTEEHNGPIIIGSPGACGR
jgi:hypothetical protein